MAINEQSDYDLMRGISISSIPFSEIRKNDKCYIDKSLMIKDVLEQDDRGVYLYTRPRRFGKSTNLTMLDTFFNVDYKGNTWFNDLEISKHPEFEKYKNAFPVVKLDLADTKVEDIDGYIDNIAQVVSNVFNVHDYLLDSNVMKPHERERFEDILRMKVKPTLIHDCIPFLCRVLERYHGSKVVILIDEYDSAISDAFGSESHLAILRYLARFLGAMLKGNDSLQLAYITGIMQIAKESIFSDLNNLKVNNIFSTMSDERFGFTEAEVKQILEEAKHPEKFDEIKQWYDGYRFGEAEVYNPYSVMNYVSNEFKAEPYWNRSGGDYVLRWLLERLSDRNLDAISSLVNGGTATVELEESLIYSDLRSNELSIYSLMAMSGYLKAVPAGNGKYDISIPNAEVRKKVDKLVGNLYPVNENAFVEFNRAVLDSDAGKMESELLKILQDASYYNLTDENVYSTIVLTLLHALVKRYEVRTEFEQGNGRVDVIMRPKVESNVPMIFELKKVGSEDDLDRRLDETMGQIHNKKYYLGMKGKVILTAMCFWGKIPKIRIEALDL